MISLLCDISKYFYILFLIHCEDVVFLIHFLIYLDSVPCHTILMCFLYKCIFLRKSYISKNFLLSLLYSYTKRKKYYIFL